MLAPADVYVNRPSHAETVRELQLIWTRAAIQATCRIPPGRQIRLLTVITKTRIR